MTVWTIGHSTRESEAFIALLLRERIERLWDVRAFPMSRRYPHFNREALALSLPAAGVEYVHAPQLGGRRSLPKDAPPTAWRNAGFKGYAAYMRTDAFRAAIAGLRAAAAEKRTTVMCAEAVHWRCHRNLISDALVALGDDVLHIGDSGVSPHKLTSFAVVSHGEVTYPPESGDQLALLDDTA
ncbi:MAG: DUF488 domain-containing protein [Gemmatimonadaceae bacterium]|nr:DUF488 domain-containing protein [Gemmatimonadaceae bacterium]